MSEVRFVVAPGEAGERLDVFLGDRVFWRSRTDLQRRIAAGAVRVDGAAVRKNTRVRAGQAVTILVDEGPATAEVPVESIPLVVLREDEHFVALDKAAGTVVHPVGRHVMDTIINALHVRYRTSETGVTPMIVHRLDRDTSGVIVFAKNPEARQRLGAAFETRQVEKTYLAIVAGGPREDSGSIDLPIGPDPASEIRLKMACVPDGRPSRTDFEVLRRGPRATLLRCRPRTGRQHQIRVHLAAAGFPILGDHLYGSPPPVVAGDVDPSDPDPGRIVLRRQALHAESLRFRHPMTGEEVFLEAALPDDLRALT